VAEVASVRLDVWLWAARFFKTRSLAKQAIEAGKVSVNDATAKPAKAVHVDDRIVVPRGDDRLDIVIVELSEKRGSGTDALRLYRETEGSIAAREAKRAQRRMLGTAPPARPDKRARQLIRAFKAQSPDD
jgi:ribosome-associated heat shock protein Hsp15